MDFGNNLRLIRKEKGLTQEQFAEMLGVSRQAVSKWESGNGYPETDKLLEMAKKLNVSLDFLMDNKASEAPETEIPADVASDNKIIVAAYDGSHTVNCLSVKYSKIVFPAKNEPAYILEGIDRVGFFGAHTVILGWYDSEEAVKNELRGIIEAMKSGTALYELKYFTNVKISAFGTAKRTE